MDPANTKPRPRPTSGLIRRGVDTASIGNEGPLVNLQGVRSRSGAIPQPFQVVLDHLFKPAAFFELRVKLGG